VESILQEADVEYRCPADATNTHLPQGELDYVVSTNVFEHVPPEVLRAMLIESKRILKPGGYILHHIDPGDHFSYDKRITTINFLQYSPRAWYYIGGSGVAYHNRLRCIDYVRLFEEHGFEIVDQASEVDRTALAALRSGRLKPHHMFRSYTPEQLCQRTIVIFARTPVT
jgi:SAM-dependent methyltransferase